MVGGGVRRIVRGDDNWDGEQVGVGGVGGIWG